MLRRLEKRILVPLPNHEARLRMFEHLLTGRVQPEVTFAHMSSKTDGYSGGYVCVRFYGWGWRCGYVGFMEVCLQVQPCSLLFSW